MMNTTQNTQFSSAQQPPARRGWFRHKRRDATQHASTQPDAPVSDIPASDVPTSNKTVSNKAASSEPALVRGVTHGPYDITEIDAASFLDELQHPPTVRPARHTNTDCDYDLPLHVWTHTISFYAPAGIAVAEERIGDPDDPDAVTEALHITVPATPAYDGFILHISAFYAPTHTQLWNEVGHTQAQHDLTAEGVDVTTTTGIWGPEITAIAEANEVYVIGADGPRWSLRVIADGYRLNDTAKALTQDVVASTVIQRGRGAFGPGTPLNIALIDRRARLQNANTTTRK